jgi:hypothetical protein
VKKQCSVLAGSAGVDRGMAQVKLTTSVQYCVSFMLLRRMAIPASDVDVVLCGHPYMSGVRGVKTRVAESLTSHGDVYEDDCLLVCCSDLSGRN